MYVPTYLSIRVFDEPTGGRMDGMTVVGGAF